jgi:hypothetical protein
VSGEIPLGWVTLEQAMVLTGLSRGSIYRYLREQYVSRPTKAPSRNGRAPRLISVDSLQGNARDLYWLRCRAVGVSLADQFGDLPGLSYSDLTEGAV